MHLYRKKGIQLDLRYQEDVAERGGVDFSQTGFNLSNQSAYRDLFIINMDQQRLAEAQPETKRREVLEYDTALARLAKSICPGCERTVDLKDTSIDYCPHCGIGLHDRCGACNTRKSTFSKYCHACGAAGAKLGEPPAATSV